MRPLAMTSATLCLIATLTFIALPLAAQSSESLDLTAVGKDPRWKVAGRTTSVVDIKGKRALELGEGKGTGVVWLDGYDFADGVVEVDMLGRSQPIQGASSAWHSASSMSGRTTRSISGRSTFGQPIRCATATPCSMSPIRVGHGKSSDRSTPTNTSARWSRNRTGTNGFMSVSSSSGQR
jgi:hypothetical protein